MTALAMLVLASAAVGALVCPLLFLATFALLRWVGRAFREPTAEERRALKRGDEP